MQSVKSQYKTQNVLALGLIIFAAVALRIVPHPPNIAPIAALALFGGVYLDKRLAILLPLFVMILSDFFLGFHDTVWFVYVSFVLVGLLGVFVRSRKTIGVIGVAALVSSVLFYLVTNFGVWFSGSMYPKTIEGLWQSYVMGLPFFRNTVVGDVFYTGVLFGGYELVKRVSLLMFRHLAKTM